ncbi:hypothetical protein M405DRAFT_240046 [Rhizopogon salebrosus TDB-379]|nr:hypothetical protein M405DRAFT_240046 [Rhizopogon salebrosus TDB-379]
MEQCWSGASHDRPSTETIVKMIREVLESPLEVSNVEAISDVSFSTYGLSVITIFGHFQSSVPPGEVLRDLTHYINKATSHSVGGGKCGEIWKRIYRTDQGSVDVRL